MARKLSAVLEVVGCFIVGAVVARMIIRSLGLTPGGVRDVAPGASVDYLALAGTMASSLLLRYGIILASDSPSGGSCGVAD